MKYAHIIASKNLSSTTQPKEEWLKHGFTIKEENAYSKCWEVLLNKFPEFKTMTNNHYDVCETIRKFKEVHPVPEECTYYSGQQVVPFDFLKAETNLFGISILKFFGEDEKPTTKKNLVFELIELVIDKFKKTPDPEFFNEKCNVIPSRNFLNEVNEVQVYADCCTEVLQELLDKGWRIIAVCVQPDGRRPDYIIGRIKNDEK